MIIPAGLLVYRAELVPTNHGAIPGIGDSSDSAP